MIDFEKLVLHAHGELDGTAGSRVDEHVLACSSCAAKLEWLLRLPRSVAEIVRSGDLALPVTSALAAELRAAGLISRSYELEPELPVPCAVSAADVYALTTLMADLRHVEQLDIVIALPGPPPLRMADVPFERGTDRSSGRVSYVTPSRLLRTLPSTRVSIELYAVEPPTERRIGRYFLEHTAWAGE